MNKDFISIGHEVCSILGLPVILYGTDPKPYEEVGKDFFKFTNSFNEHHLLKQIRFGMQGLNLIKYGAAHIEDIGCNHTITFTYNDARCSVILCSVKPDDKSSASFMIRDLSGFVKQFAVITSIESMRDGAAKELLKYIIDLIGGELPIVLSAGCMYSGDYYTELDATINKNVAYYSNLGFRDVNNVIGGYEESCTMLYCDDELYNKIMEFRKS